MIQGISGKKGKERQRHAHRHNRHLSSLHRYSHEMLRAARERIGKHEAEKPSEGENRQKGEACQKVSQQKIPNPKF